MAAALRLQHQSLLLKLLLLESVRQQFEPFHARRCRSCSRFIVVAMTSAVRATRRSCRAGAAAVASMITTLFAVHWPTACMHSSATLELSWLTPGWCSPWRTMNGSSSYPSRPFGTLGPPSPPHGQADREHQPLCPLA